MQAPFHIVTRFVLGIARLALGVLSIALGITSSIALVHAEEPLRTRTHYIDFKPTLVPDVRLQEISIPASGVQGAYKVVQNVDAPFRLVTKESELVIRNNVLKIAAEFAPKSGGGFIDTLKLAREFNPQNFDTLRIVLTGTAYYIDRKEQLEFGRVLIGDTAKRRLYLRRDNTGEQTWLVDPPTRPTPPFRLVSLTPSNIPSTDTSFFLFEFAPMQSQMYRDTVRLVRMHGQEPLDTILVYLIGTGFDLNDRTTIDFPTVLTADSVVKSKSFYKPLASEYRVVKKPTAPSPFLITSLDKNDSIVASISFVPLQKQQYLDTIILERVRELQGSKPLDTIMVFLKGAGAHMKGDGIVLFSNVKVNDVVQSDLEVRLDPEPQTKSFSYHLRQVDQGPATGAITEPTQPSKSERIMMTFSTAPIQFATTQQQFVLTRNVGDGNAVDSMTIAVTTEMMPRPVELSVRFEQDTTSLRIGDTTTLRLFIEASGDLDRPITVKGASGRIGYNASVIVPLPPTDWNRVVDGDRVYLDYTAEQVNGIVVNGPRTLLAEFPVVGVLGDADHTVLDLQSWTLSDGQIVDDVDSYDGLIQLTNIWRYNGSNGRLVNSLQGLLGLEIDPNPVVGTSTLRVSNVANGVGELVIVDVNGALVQDLTSQLRAGTREFAISKGTGASVMLGPGSYYARLLVRGATGETVNSIARLFVVQ